MEKSLEEKGSFYYLKVFLLLFVSLLFIESLFKIVTFKYLFGLETITILLFTATTSALISLVCYFSKPIISKIIILTFVFFIGIYTIGQLNFKNFMDNYMSLNAAGEGGFGRVTDQIVHFVSAIKPVYFICLLPFITILILFFAKKIDFQKEKFNKLRVLFFILLVISLHLLSLVTLELKFLQNKNQIRSNKELYENPTLIELSLKQLGITRFLIRDFVYMVSPKKEIIIEVDLNVDKDPEQEITDYTRIFDDSNWLNMIDNEDNSVIKNLHEYYINKSITDKNEYTGMFKDKNMILIMVEAFDMIAINESLTPNLYKLSKEGWYFDNYYAPKYSCTTGESEFIGLTSIIPSSTVCTPNTYSGNTYPTSIFSLFNSSEYKSTSYHNWKDQFYDRRILHSNMGSSNYYNYDDLNIKVRTGWPSDLTLMEKSIPKFIDEDKFFSFIITSSMHFPYDEGSDIVSKHWDKVKDLPYNDKIKRYMAKAIDLDEGIGHLLNSLEEKGILKDTVITLFGDHHPLNMGLSNLNQLSEIDRTVDYNADKLPFIIYNSEMDSKTISKTASTFDVLPTIANLFDLEYDPRYYIGKDIFSEGSSTVIFTNGSWITDKAIYFASSGDYKKLSDDVDDQYIQMINKQVTNKFYVSNQTLIKNYFKYRFNE